MCFSDSGQSAASVRSGRSVFGRARDEEALVLKAEVPPGPAEAVSAAFVLRCSLGVLACYGLSFVCVCSVMDGMTEACVKGGIEACYTSVSCACALLGALDELLKGRGIQPEQVRTLL